MQKSYRANSMSTIGEQSNKLVRTKIILAPALIIIILMQFFTVTAGLGTRCVTGLDKLKLIIEVPIHSLK